MWRLLLQLFWLVVELVGSIDEDQIPEIIEHLIKSFVSVSISDDFESVFVEFGRFRSIWSNSVYFY